MGVVLFGNSVRDSSMKSWKRPSIEQTLYGFATLALATVSVVYMSRRAFGDYDSRFDYAMGSNSLSDRSWFLGFMSNPLTGLQSIDQATLRWLEPHSLLLIWLGSPWGVVIAATMTFVIVGLSCNYLLRTIGFTVTQSRWTALLVAGNTVGGEFVGLSGIDFYRIVPSSSTMLAGAYLLTALVLNQYQSEDMPLRKKLLGTFFTFILSVWLSITHTHYITMTVPFIVIVVVVVLVTRGWRRGRVGILNLAPLLVLWTTWFAIGAARFEAGMFFNTALVELPKQVREIEPLDNVLAIQEALFPLHRYDRLTLVLCILLLTGLLMNFWTRRPGELGQTLLLVVSVVFLLFIFRRFRQTGGNFPLSPPYVAWSFLPLLVAGAAAGVTKVFDAWTLLAKQLSPEKLRASVKLLLILGIVIVGLLSVRAPIGVFVREWEAGPTEFPTRNSTELFRTLNNQIGLSETNQSFRGRVAFLGASENSYEIDFPELAIRKIPTIHNQGHFQSPAFVWFIETLFRDGLPLSNVKNNYPFQHVSNSALRMVGVRYVVVHNNPAARAKLNHAFSTKIEEVGDFLIEIESPNIKGVQLTKVANDRSLRDYLQRVRRDEVEPGEFFLDSRGSELIGADVLNSRLTESSFRYFKSDIQLTAKSSGVTLLVLPIEYSHCLRLRSDGADRDAKLIPVNGVLTGLLFNRTVSTTITYRTGPLTNPNCRVQDLQDFRRYFAYREDG